MINCDSIDAKTVRLTWTARLFVYHSIEFVTRPVVNMDIVKLGTVCIPVYQAIIISFTNQIMFLLQ